MKKYSKHMFTFALLSIIICFIIIRNLPASYIADYLSTYTNGKFRLINTKGNIWRGSGYIAFAYGVSDTNPKVINSPITWDISLKIFNWDKTRIFIHHKDINSGTGFEIYPIAKKTSVLKAEIPAEILQGLGGPFQSLELYGKITLHAKETDWKNLPPDSIINITLDNMYSQKIPQRELGSYNIDIQIAKPQYPFEINTKTGILNIKGKGQIKPIHLTASASVYDYYAKELLPLLTMLGKVNNNKVEINL